MASRLEPVRICFVLPGAQRSGGAAVVLDHALSLSTDERWAPELVLTAGDPAQSNSPNPLPARTLAEARTRHYDIAIATWWETTQALWELKADRRVCFLQSFEQRFYGDDELVEQLGAEAVLALPVDFIVVATWMRELLLELRPEANVVQVPNGIDATVFGAARPARGDGPLRVLIEGQPSLWFKGVVNAVEAAAAMEEPAVVTLLALDPVAGHGLSVDRVVGALEPHEVAEVYAETDVLLKLSRVESLGLPPLEAMHAGVPSVVAPFTGHAEYLAHGVNGVVVPFDDLSGATRWLDVLARDRELLERLSRGASETAAAWPSPEQSSDAFADALTAIAASAPPQADARLLQRTLALHGHLGRDQAGKLAYLEAALASARAHVDEVSRGLDDCTDAVAARSAELVALKSTRSYRLHRASARLRELVKR